MSLKPVKFKLIETENTAVKAFDAKILLQIAKATEKQKKLEVELLDLKISQVDEEIAQTLVEKESASKPVAVSAGKENQEQKVCKQETQVPQQADAMKSSREVGEQYVNQNDSPRKAVRQVEAPIAREKPSALSSRSSGRSHTICVHSDTGFDMIQSHEIHQVFSEDGKVVDITRSEDNREVFITFESLASAFSAVKHAPRSIGHLNDLEVYHA